MKNRNKTRFRELQNDILFFTPMFIKKLTEESQPVSIPHFEKQWINKLKLCW